MLYPITKRLDQYSLSALGVLHAYAMTVDHHARSDREALAMLLFPAALVGGLPWLLPDWARLSLAATLSIPFIWAGDRFFDALRSHW
jgi:hypothetical protein